MLATAISSLVPTDYGKEQDHPRILGLCVEERKK